MMIFVVGAFGASAQKFTHGYGNTLYNEGIASFQMPDSGYVTVANATGYMQNTAPYIFFTDKNGVIRKDLMLSKPYLVNLKAAVMKDFKLYLGGYALIQGNYQFMVIKTDTSGNILSEKSWGGSGWDFIHGLTINPGDTLFYCGESSDTTFGYSNGVAGALNQNFISLWHNTIGGSWHDALYSINTDGTTDLICAGASASYTPDQDTAILLYKLGQDGATNWLLTENAPGPDIAWTIRPDLTGGYFMCGQTSRWPLYGKQGFLMKLDMNGAYEWIQQYNDEEEDCINDAIQTGSGNYQLAGYNTGTFSSGGKDLMLNNCGSDGFWSPLLPAFIIGGLGDDEGRHILQTIDGGFLITGTGRSYLPRLSSVLLVKCDTNGNHNQYSGHQTPVNELSGIGSALKVYPNPAGEMLHCSLPEELLFQTVSYQIIDLAGRTLLEGTRSPNSGKTLVIPLRELKPGSFVLCINDSRTLFQKL